jgi:hypothetical protein
MEDSLIFDIFIAFLHHKCNSGGKFPFFYFESFLLNDRPANFVHSWIIKVIFNSVSEMVDSIMICNCLDLFQLVALCTKLKKYETKNFRTDRKVLIENFKFLT